MADLVRLTAPNGSTVRVSTERAKALQQQGFTAEKKSTRKASSKKSDTDNE